MADHQKYQNGDTDLDALFAEARQARPDLPDRLMSTITAAAAAEQARWSAPAPARRRSPLGVLLAALGGWPAVGGLVAASCTGLWIGVAGPEAVFTAPGVSALAATPTVSSEYAAYETFDLATVMAEDMQ